MVAGSQELARLQDLAYERINERAAAYVASSAATELYVQDTLFDWSIRQRHETDFRAERDKMRAEYPDSILLFPDEFTELRLKAVYFAVCLAHVQREDIPRDVRNRLSDNLENYPPRFDHDVIG